jgi:hypothetical protein
MPDDTPSKEEIRTALKRLGITQTELGKHVDAAPNVVSLWLQDKMTSKRLDAAIPAFLRGIEFGSTRAA